MESYEFLLFLAIILISTKVFHYGIPETNCFKDTSLFLKK